MARRSARTIMLSGLLAGAFAAMLVTGCRKALFDGVAFDPPEPVPAVALTQGDGAPFNFSKQHGSIVVLFFGYTHCPDVCPTTLSDWTKAKRMLGTVARNVRFVFVSVDHARDTPAITQRYAASFDPAFLGLSGDSVAIEKAEQAFHVTSVRENATSPTDYTVTHAGQTFVIDQHGTLRVLYEPGTPVTYLVADLKRLLRGA